MGRHTLETKRCLRCSETKQLSEFYARQGHCKVCQKAQAALWKQSNREGNMLHAARQRAKQANVPFDIKLEDIDIPERCPALWMRLQFGDLDAAPSLDRINPSLGYVKGNVIVVSNMANRIKNNATVSDLMAVANFYQQLEQRRRAT